MKSAVGLTVEMEEHNRIVNLFHTQVGIKKIAEVVGVHEITVRHVVARCRERGNISRASPSPLANEKRMPDFMERLRAKIDEDPLSGTRVETKE